MSDELAEYIETRSRQITPGGWIWFVIKYIAIAFVIMLPIQFLVAQPFLISGASMAPAFGANEYVVIDKITYDFQRPNRGDVIVFHYPLDPSIFFIKRIVGLPGEVVDIHNGIISVHSKTDASHPILAEPYLVEGQKKQETSTVTLADDEYFVLGDNRDESSDSREWGPLQHRLIIGRVVFRLYPLSKVGPFPGRYSFSAMR